MGAQDRAWKDEVRIRYKWAEINFRGTVCRRTHLAKRQCHMRRANQHSSKQCKFEDVCPLIASHDTFAQLRTDETHDLSQRQLPRVHVVRKAVSLSIGAGEGQILQQDIPFHTECRDRLPQSRQREQGVGGDDAHLPGCRRVRRVNEQCWKHSVKPRSAGSRQQRASSDEAEAPHARPGDQDAGCGHDAAEDAQAMRHPDGAMGSGEGLRVDGSRALGPWERGALARSLGARLGAAFSVLGGPWCGHGGLMD
mmetsp:Transcript_35376/g.88060  ORF Transcript_35376/g.88060 Transcript_35376/m.88060 type:complete len:252 (-) Transcript_35376:2-757(-)